MRICHAASELVPLAKTGGLGDVTAALCGELRQRGHDVRPFLPLYSTIDRAAHALVPVDFLQNVPVKLGWRTFHFSVWTTRLAPNDLAVYLVDCPELLHRSGIYTSDDDEPRRFVAFCHAVLVSCQHMGWSPEVLHLHDWHTALVPVLLRTTYAWDRLFAPTRTALTIHNIGYQGVFSRDWIDDLGLGDFRHMFDPEDLAAGRVNLLRSGLIYSDVVTTVSPTYAREIQTPSYGMGLEGLLRARSDRLVGILNGVDYGEWSPENDRFLPVRYSAGKPAGKRHNKADLLRTLGLGEDTRPPLVGVISRLAHQKGFDLCVPVLPELLATTALRLVVLGSGERRYEEFFEWLQQRFPERVVFHRGYHNELAHRIEAAADMLLMPSRYEPCGLNQMFSLRYGTIPVVRRTGGLADSVEEFDPASGRGTGFVFDHFTPQGLRWALDRALATYGRRSAWRRLVLNAMARDFSWETQVRRYEELYAWLVDGPGASGAEEG